MNAKEYKRTSTVIQGERLITVDGPDLCDLWDRSLGCLLQECPGDLVLEA